MCCITARTLALYIDIDDAPYRIYNPKKIKRGTACIDGRNVCGLEGAGRGRSPSLLRSPHRLCCEISHTLTHR